MDQKIEIERMEAAFKRAAEKAMNGTRDERAGRFELRDDADLTNQNLNAEKVKANNRVL